MVLDALHQILGGNGGCRYGIGKQLDRPNFENTAKPLQLPGRIAANQVPVEQLHLPYIRIRNAAAGGDFIRCEPETPPGLSKSNLRRDFRHVLAKGRHPRLRVPAWD
jgi:hypothetical protein